MDGLFEPGAPLVEVWLAEWCGVSRTPVREALTRLEQDGMVERGERGLVVRDRSPSEILDIYDTRIVLETSAARLAAERHDKFDRIRLESAARACEKAETGDAQALAKCNVEFHRSVWQAGHNETLIDLLDRLNLHLMRYPATTLSYPGRWPEALAEHGQLIDAIFQSDADAAAHAASVHFNKAREIRLALWEQDTF